ncbi:MAG: class I SAM-dependent methyltransferase [Candidatus Nitrosopolaris sp.]
MTTSQNIWKTKGPLMIRQKRRAQIVKRSLTDRNVNMILDIGCAEGYTTSFISETSALVVGVELNKDSLKIAKSKVNTASFINASLEYLPFREDTFDAVSILEVLEHLPVELQHNGMKEANRVLRPNGFLLLSTPYKELISYTNCIYCKRDTPLWGHLHSLDENKITDLLPSHFKLTRKCILPNFPIISCSNILESLPLSAWLLINNSLGLISKGYWIVLRYLKT